MSYARRSLQLSPYATSAPGGVGSSDSLSQPHITGGGHPGGPVNAAAVAAAAEFGMENMLMDPRWSSMGQYLGDSRDLLELERRAQLQISKI